MSWLRKLVWRIIFPRRWKHQQELLRQYRAMPREQKLRSCDGRRLLLGGRMERNMTPMNTDYTKAVEEILAAFQRSVVDYPIHDDWRVINYGEAIKELTTLLLKAEKSGAERFAKILKENLELGEVVPVAPVEADKARMLTEILRGVKQPLFTFIDEALATLKGGEPEVCKKCRGRKTHPYGANRYFCGRCNGSGLEGQE